MKDLVTIFIKGNTSFIINALRRQNVQILGVKEVDGGADVIVRKSRLKHTEKCLIDYGRDYTIKERFGVLFLVKSLFKRVGIFIAVAIIIFLGSLYSDYVFGVEIVGDALPFVDEAEVILEDFDFPLKKSEVDLAAIESKAYRIDDVSYATATIEGSKLRLTLVGVYKPDEIIDLDCPTDIVATSDAIVTRVVTFQGTPLVKVGDIVKKGSVLISATVNITEELSVDIAAAGEVYGKVLKTEKIAYKKVYTEEVATGNKTTKTSFGFLKFDKKATSPYELYDEVIKDVFSIPLLNIYVKKHTFIEKQQQEEILDFDNNEEDIVNKAFEQFRSRLDQDSIIENRGYEVKRLDNYYILELYYLTEEKIYESQNHRQSP